MSVMDENKIPCDICAQSKIATKIVRCKNDHIFCTRCLKQIGRLGNSRCPYANCKRKLIRPSCQKSASGDAQRKMFSLQPVVEQSIQDIRESCSTIFKTEDIISLQLSKRPVFCPHQSCNRTVAVSSLSSHFLYEHRTIQRSSVTFEQRTRINCNIVNLKRSTRHTLLYLELVADKEEMGGSGNSGLLSRFLHPPVILVMVYKFPLLPESSNRHVVSDDSSDESSAEADVLNLEADSDDAEDKIMIWLGANVATPFAYTVAASTRCETVRIKYYGPLGTIHEEPPVLRDQGLGLTFTQATQRKMAATGGGDLVLDLMIHPERDDVFVDIDSG